MIKKMPLNPKEIFRQCPRYRVTYTKIYYIQCANPGRI